MCKKNWKTILPKYVLFILCFPCSWKGCVFWPRWEGHPGVIEDFSTQGCTATALGLCVAFGKGSVTCAIPLTWRIICKEQIHKSSRQVLFKSLQNQENHSPWLNPSSNCYMFSLRDNTLLTVLFGQHKPCLNNKAGLWIIKNVTFSSKCHYIQRSCKKSITSYNRCRVLARWKWRGTSPSHFLACPFVCWAPLDFIAPPLIPFLKINIQSAAS